HGLVEERVVFLPLSHAGSSDKMTVQFRQAKDGVPVLDGCTDVLFDLAGNVLSVDTTAVRGLANVPTKPSLSAERAVVLATGWFADDTGLRPTSVSAPELVIDQPLVGKFRVPTLAWQVDVQYEVDGFRPEGFAYRVDAFTGARASRAATVHHDVSGTVKSFATPALMPDVPANAATSQPMPAITVTSSSGNAVTDANGNFTIPGASAPLAVQVRYQGTFSTVNHVTGSSYVLSTNAASGSGNTLTMNSPAVGTTTAQANAFLWTNKLRNWVRAVNPSDATADFLATSNVNLSSTCNAYFNGSSVNFFLPGGGCPNTSYSTVIAHELGHWYNVRYGSGNGADGFGEGNADVFAMYLVNDPVVADDFFGAGSYIRSGLNTRPFCGDTNGGCYGEVHADGEVLMGALWKVRTRLQTALGQSAGSLAADTLFNGWMNAYNDSQIKSLIEIHWLTLDDDDGDVSNGTPNFNAIDLGFRDQGFPGYALSFVTLSNVTPIPSAAGVGPFNVSADAVAKNLQPVASVAIRWRSQGSSTFQTTPMTLVSGNTWTGSVPAQPCPSTLEYYVIGTDSAGKTGTFPDQAPTYLSTASMTHSVSIYSTGFENGAAGWTHGAITGNDEWQLSSDFALNVSAGKSGDPTVPASGGSSVLGTDLGAGASDGAYDANQTIWLRSPLIDCSASTETHLRFKRWLNVERSQNDAATIKVNGTLLWTNLAYFDTFDTSWVPVDFDISALADGNPAVQIEFRLKSDGSVGYGGWNVDDFEIVAYSCDTGCPARISYCDGKVNSNAEIPTIASSGTPQLSTQNFSIDLTSGTYSKLAVVFWGTAPANSPFLGGTLCVKPPVERGVPLTTSATGTATYPVPVTALMVGTTLYYQWWMRDPADAQFVGLSNGLQVQFCN
ncbi:MAG: hypothetical protein IT453_05915, partial [Planctomycetes bacterium]|nr:hypothetical protein [Planctomycetota bacterium]